MDSKVVSNMCSCSYDRANSMINSKSFSYLRRIINFYLSNHSA